MKRHEELATLVVHGFWTHGVMELKVIDPFVSDPNNPTSADDWFQPFDPIVGLTTPTFTHLGDIADIEP